MSTTLIPAPGFTAEIDGDDFAVADPELKLDATAVPYAAGSLTLPLLDEATLDFLDAPGDVRIPVTAGGRLFDLSLRRRTVDHSAKTTTLDLASDEALAQRYAPLTDDATPRTHQASLRAVCNYVLNLVSPGAALEAGGPDANVTAYWGVSNLIANPSFENTVANWAIGSNGSGLAPNSSKAFSGTYNGHWSQPSGAPSWIDSAKMGVRAGVSYVASAYMSLVVGAAGTAQVAVRFYAGDTPLVTYNGTAVAVSTAAWTRASHIITAPPGATHATVHLIHTGAAGRFPCADAVMFHEGSEVIPYFDGGTADSGTYTYDWNGAANAAPSTRTPVLERPIAALTWQAGQTAWDFLMTLAASVEMILWCDEERRWYLQAADARTLPTLISVNATTTRNGEDTIDRDDPDTGTTGVVCRYRWTDENGITRQQNDSAGTPGNVLTVDFANTPYRPGVAAAMLARRAGTTRNQDVTCITHWNATPSMTASISLPGAPDTFGRIAAVEFHPDGFMTLTMAGLIDIIPGSIAALVGTIDSLVGTIDSL